MSDSPRTSQAVRPSSPSSSNNPLSIEALEEIVRNCQRNEQRLHDLERHTRHERKKAERLLRETNRVLHDQDQGKSREFFVPLDDDDDDDDDEQRHHQQQQQEDDRSEKTTGHSSRHNQQDLLDRVEKLLAGDGTTTTAASSEVMSSQERKKKVSLDTHQRSPRERIEEENKFRPHSRQLPSACSIEYELSTVDRLLAERTPNHEEHKISSKHSSPFDERDERFYERLNNYVQTGRFISPSESAPMAHPVPVTVPTSRPVSKMSAKDDELADLARRCEDLLSRLHTQRQRAEILEHATQNPEHYRRLTPSPPSRPIPIISSIALPPPPPPMSLQQALELLRPDFISRSRQRARRVRLLREEREHNTEIDRERRQMLLFSCNTCCSKPSTNSHSRNTSHRALSAPPTRRSVSFVVPHDRSTSSRVPVSYQEMKQATKKKYQQLPEVHDRQRQMQMEEIRRRNVLRAKVFRARLRQHVQRHGRTNIDESLTMIDT